MDAMAALLERVLALEARLGCLERAEVIPTSLMAPDGDPNPAWSVDADGNLSGAAGCEMSVASTITSTGEGYFAGDQAGIMERVANCYRPVTDHFRSGSAPAGYAWDDTPYSVDYHLRDDYLYTRPDFSTVHHLYKSMGTSYDGWRGKYVEARCGVSASTVLGGIMFKYQTGGTWYFARVHIYVSSAASYALLSWNLPAGSGSSSVGPLGVAGQLFTLRLYHHSSDVVFAYLFNEIGIATGIGSTPAVSGALQASRAGLVVESNHASSYAYCMFDWMADS